MISRWYLLCFICLFSLGCCHQSDLELGAAITAWAPYAPQQEITFKNAAGQEIKFIAGRRQYNQSGQDKVCGSYAIEALETTLTPLSDPNFKIQITLSHEVLVSLKAFSTAPAASNVAIQFNTVAEKYVSDDWRDRYLKQFELNGQVYAQVLRAYGYPTAHPLALSELYYAREKGLVAFKTFSGDWYYLQ